MDTHEKDGLVVPRPRGLVPSAAGRIALASWSRARLTGLVGQVSALSLPRTVRRCSPVAH